MPSPTGLFLPTTQKWVYPAGGPHKYDWSFRQLLERCFFVFCLIEQSSIDPFKRHLQETRADFVVLGAPSAKYYVMCFFSTVVWLLGEPSLRGLFCSAVDKIHPPLGMYDTALCRFCVVYDVIRIPIAGFAAVSLSKCVAFLACPAHHF